MPNEGIPLPLLRKHFKADPLSLVGTVPGLFLVNKPSGPSSHDIVARARKKLGTRRVGHGGTLDPMANGLLIIMAGNAARLFDELRPLHKSYSARMELGRRTDTYDATGIDIDYVPARSLPVTAEELEAVLEGFRGPIRQTPPMFSALKKNGKPLYELARQGIEVEREAREMMVYSLEATAISDSTIAIEMTVSTGFYVRSLVEDVGLALGCGAVMTHLTRGAIGPYKLEDAVSVDEIQSCPFLSREEP